MSLTLGGHVPWAFLCVGSWAAVAVVEKSYHGLALKSYLIGVFPQVNKKVTFSLGAWTGMLRTDGPGSLKCQGGIISTTYSASFCTLPPLCSGRLRKVICTFDSFYVNIWLRINGGFPWSKISRPLLKLVPRLAHKNFGTWCVDTWRLRCQISTSFLHHPLLGVSLTHSVHKYTRLRTQRLKAPLAQ